MIISKTWKLTKEGLLTSKSLNQAYNSFSSKLKNGKATLIWSAINKANNLLTEKEILETPVPTFPNVVPSESAKTTDVSYPIYPNSVKHWKSIPNTSADNTDRRYSPIKFRISVEINNEDSVKLQFYDLVKDVFDERIFLDRKDKKDSTFHFGSVDRKNLLPGNFQMNSRSDLALLEKRKNGNAFNFSTALHVIMPIEVKTSKSIASYKRNEVKELHEYYIDGKSNRIELTILKLFTYMVRNKNKYGLLTCLDKSWFFKIESIDVDSGKKGDLYISSPIKIENLFKQIFNVYQLAKDNPDQNVDIEPLPAKLLVSKSGGRSESGQRGLGSLVTQNQNTNMITINVEPSSICGYGRSGNVYRATYDTQQLAVKYCTHKELFHEVESEVCFLKELNDAHCEHVPNLIHAYKDDGTYVVISEFIDGQHMPLEQVPFKETYKFEQALRAVHAHGILHGDIKDENFVMTKDKIYVLDFGMSRKAKTQSELDEEFNLLRDMMGLPPNDTSLI